MKTLLMVALTLLGFRTFAQPIANAGADKTIYLTQTSNVTLDGSGSSGTSFLWREISTDYLSGASITTPNSKITTVTGLPQGVFYFELAATSAGITKRDSMKVIVDYDVPPANSTLKSWFDLSGYWILRCINWRGDTINHFPNADQIHMQCGDDSLNYLSNQWWDLYRDRMNGIMIDSLRGKIYTTIEDGYGSSTAPNGIRYARSEIQIGSKNVLVDTNYIYVYEWKGYFPHPTDSNYLANDPTNSSQLMTIFQIHGDEYDYAIVNFEMRKDGIYFRNEITGSQSELNDTYSKESVFIAPMDSFYNKAHTLRITLREGLAYPGQKAFIKVEFDGITKYYRNKGGVGSAYFNDYVKWGTLYDWNVATVNPDSLSRGRKFSIANESFKRYILPETPPLVSAGDIQFITLPTTYTTLSGRAEAGGSSITSYQWSKVYGSNATITNPSSLSTTVTGLNVGRYVFNLTVSDGSGATGSSNIEVLVDSNRTINLTGYNYDVIVDGVLNGIVGNLRNHDLDGSGFSFYADGFSTNSTPLKFGLPSDGKIISPTNTLYQLQPYDQNNALWLSSGQSGSLNLVSPQAYQKIKLAVTSGGTPVNYTVNYKDGTSDNGTLNLSDWSCYSCSSFVINGLGRTDINGFGSGSWAIYEDSIVPNPNKVINSITFEPLASWVSVFALSSQVNPAANIPPTASAGSDQTITLPTNSISLNGTGTDTDGSIASYQWTKISGTGGTIANSNKATATVTN